MKRLIATGDENIFIAKKRKRTDKNIIHSQRKKSFFYSPIFQRIYVSEKVTLLLLQNKR